MFGLIRDVDWNLEAVVDVLNSEPNHFPSPAAPPA